MCLAHSVPYIQRRFALILKGYVIVYDVTNEQSFYCMDRLKKLIEKNKEKKEVQPLNNSSLKSIAFLQFVHIHLC